MVPPRYSIRGAGCGYRKGFSAGGWDGRLHYQAEQAISQGGKPPDGVAARGSVSGRDPGREKAAGLVVGWRFRIFVIPRIPPKRPAED